MYNDKIIKFCDFFLKKNNKSCSGFLLNLFLQIIYDFLKLHVSNSNHTSSIN